MISQKRQLNKKRKHIFVIQKNENINKPEEKIVKSQNNISTKISISLLNEDNESKEIHNSNLDEEEDNTKENKKYSLIEISRLVKDFIQKKKNTTGNEVTEYVKNYLHPKKSNESIQKNIQRRVYDAINVMSAVGLIKKNKQQIKIIDKNSNSNHISLDENVENDDNDKNQIIENKNNIEKLQKELIKKYFYIKFYEKINRLNKLKPGRSGEENIIFPFELIKCDKRAPVKIKKNEDSTRYIFFSDSELSHFDEYNVVKRFVGPDILKKLNNIHNNDNLSNKSINKSNSKKSTIEESLNENIDNKRNEEDKIYFFEKDDYNEDEIFNYIKNLKFFRDELSDIVNHKSEEIFENQINDNNKSQENNKEDDTLNNKNQIENIRIYKAYNEEFMKPECDFNSVCIF